MLITIAMVGIGVGLLLSLLGIVAERNYNRGFVNGYYEAFKDGAKKETDII